MVLTPRFVGSALRNLEVLVKMLDGKLSEGLVRGLEYWSLLGVYGERR